MKKLIQTFLPILVICSQVFAIAGFGAYGDFDLLKYPDGISGNKATSGVEYEGFDNAKGFGLLFYIDAIPVVDLEVDLEFVGNIYKYTPYIGGLALSKGEMPWGRVSTYMTLRKEILGLSIPLLAKAQLYGGLGFNKPLKGFAITGFVLGCIELMVWLITLIAGTILFVSDGGFYYY